MSRLPTTSTPSRTGVVTPAPLSLRIDRLVLDGLSPEAGGSERMRVALEAEIAALFASGALHPALRAGGALPQLRIDAAGLREGDNAEQLGRSIAGALHQGIG